MSRTVAALLLFGISFGYLEAAVVVYLRAIYDPIRERVHPGRPAGDLFPLISPEQLHAAGPENTKRLGIEIGREAATIIMLAAVGLAAGRNFNQRMAAFSIAFGLWDISFYAFLKLMLGWPQSLFTWDILFLIPLPWVGPGAGARSHFTHLDRLRIVLAAARRHAGQGLAMAGDDYWRIGCDSLVRLGFSKHHRGRPAESVQLAVVSGGPRHRAGGFYCRSKESRISGISNTARFLMAAAFARKRAKLTGASSSSNPRSISRNDFNTTPACISRIHSVL
jgi:hypothetical protein